MTTIRLTVLQSCRVNFVRYCLSRAIDVTVDALLFAHNIIYIAHANSFYVLDFILALLFIANNFVRLYLRKYVPRIFILCYINVPIFYLLVM